MALTIHRPVMGDQPLTANTALIPLSFSLNGVDKVAKPMVSISSETKAAAPVNCEAVSTESAAHRVPLD